MATIAPLKGFDTALDMRRQAGALRRQGYDFVIRYDSHNPARNLTPGEARSLCGAGLRIGAVRESAGTHAGYFSRQQGVLDGAAALAQARAAGQPTGSAIYFAVDYDATRAGIDAPVSAYFSGVRAALNGAAGYRLGVYGSGLCCGAMLDRGLASLSWRSQSGGFCGSRDYAQAMRHDLIQSLGTRLSLDGAALEIDPDASNPQRGPEHDPGLFLLAA
ncbi:DUF1906 domain-containing protein [Massilia sp. DD77]|uniref:DUF1906 domain-containing protein n=1 Tax=Massilia sp. DD77 TaxID=3109349 RepID=UPI0030000125